MRHPTRALKTDRASPDTHDPVNNDEEHEAAPPNQKGAASPCHLKNRSTYQFSARRCGLNCIRPRATLLLD